MTAPAAPPAVEPTEPSLETVVTQTLGEDLEELTELIPTLAADLTEVDHRIVQVIRSTYPTLTDAATYAVSAGGKRVRPLLMAAGFRSLGQESASAIVSLAAAFQLIHTATLVHDDVIDHAEMRRGRPSMPRAFGLPAAIVAGDYLFVRAFELAAEYPRSIILRCGEACANLVEGEVLQDTSRFDLTSGREHYFRIVERKTAAIVAAALGSVAEIAGASLGVIDAFADYGRSLGMAFQIRDDYLDVFGDPDLLGKPRYGDFREGNPTLLSLLAFQQLEGLHQAEFERLFTIRRKAPGDLLRLRALIEESRARQEVEAEAERWGERAIASLQRVPRSPYRRLLERTARAVATRRF